MTDYNSSNSVEKRVKSLNKFFSLKFKVENVDKLLLKQRLTQQQVNFIKSIWRVAEDVLPGQCDIQFRLSTRPIYHTNTYGANAGATREFINRWIVEIDTVYIIIHYPEITITNSRDESLTIKDIFIRISISIMESGVPSFKFNSVCGTRTTLSLLEYFTDFYHSHISSYDCSKIETRCVFQDFCLGAEGDIRAVQALLNGGYDEDLMRLLLLEVKPVLEWESLESTPYRHIEDVIEKDYEYPNVGMTECMLCYKALISFMQINPRRVREILNINWKFYNGKYQIVDDEKFEDLFRNLYVLADNRVNFYFLLKDSQGNYFVETPRINKEQINSQGAWLPFRGQKIYFKVEGEVRRAGPQNMYVHPKIKDYVKQRLEFFANFSEVRKAGAKRIDTYNSARRNTIQDKVSM